MTNGEQRFHDSIVFVDESGDHGVASSDYPVFVLAFCMFEKTEYVRVSGMVQDFKLKYFGHNAVVLHERDIRRALGPFRILKNVETRAAFMTDLTELIEDAEFKLVAAVMDKRQGGGHEGIYETAMQLGLERVAMEYDLRHETRLLHLVCERRGTGEDAALELAFRRNCMGVNYAGDRFPCEIVFAPKGRCHAGLEIADLIARPIGQRVLGRDPKPWPIIEKKFRRNPYTRRVIGYGLKVF